MKKYTIALTALTLMASAGCKDNPAAPSIDRIPAGSGESLQTLLTGLVGSDRAASAGAYYEYGSLLARDVIRPDQNEPRWTTEFYSTPPDPSGFGDAVWADYYTALRAAHTLLNDSSVKSLPAINQAAARGFILTLEAREYLDIIEYHDKNGAVIQGDDPQVVYPIRAKPAVLTYISALLDSASGDFAAAGDTTTVPFNVPAGYQSHGDYSRVSNLELYNRGLKGKTELYLALQDAANPDVTHASAALAALNIALAGATPTATYLDLGPYYEFTPATPDILPNPLVNVKFLLTTNFVSSIQSGDARKTNIIAAVPLSQSGFTSAPYRLAITDPSNTANLTAPLPILRNGELFLLRAQAEIALGNLAAATSDINVVHTVEGGLTPYATFTTAAAAIQGLLYEYRYSFPLEGPQHLIALREYGLLNDDYISQPGIPTPGVGKDPLNQMLPIPTTESGPRNGNITPLP